ncbi:MAG: primase-helicase zinc-binding domain-containing protein, partial [Leucothrix sp.]
PKEKNGPCPLCGGKDRAHFKNTDGKVLLYCRHCETHWADEILLDLAFNNDFGRMCAEIGEYLNLIPEERETRTKAVKKVYDEDLQLARPYIDKAAILAQTVEQLEFHPYLLRYGIGADCYTHNDYQGALFPFRVSGKLSNWVGINTDGEQFIIGDQIARAAKLVLKPQGDHKKKIFITHDIIDAYYLFQASKQSSIVICCGDIRNMQAVTDKIKDYQIIAALPRTLDAFEWFQTMPYDFITPDEYGRKFKEADYAYKPTKIYSNIDAGKIFTNMLDSNLE